MVPSFSSVSLTNSTNLSRTRRHRDQRESLELVGLHQRRDLERFVERAESARHHDERARVLHQHHLAREEVVELDELVEVRIGLLLARQRDVAADAQAACFLGAPFAASMIPEPPPVITANPARASAAPTSRASW